MHTAMWVGVALSVVGAFATARLIGVGRAAPVVAEAAA
jgi:hypothetical protein